MSWTTTDWTPGEIQADADEFWKALNERRQAIGSAVVNEPAVGANIQSGSSAAPPSTTGKFGWRYLQNQIAALCPSFVQSHSDAGAPRATNYYHGKATIDMWDFPTLMKAVRGGTAQSDFRRATSYPADWTSWADAAYSDGRVAEGDIFGPWIPTDIQKALNMLVWTKPYCDWEMPTGADNWQESTTLEHVSGSWAAAKTLAETEFAGNTGHSAGFSPYANSGGSWSFSAYLGWLRRCENHLKVTGMWAGCSRSIDYFGKATAITIWNAHGDSNVLEDLFGLFSTHTPEPAAEHYSPLAWGSIGTAPAWCGEPIETDPIKGTGWETDTEAAVVRWNVTGGFSYA